MFDILGHKYKIVQHSQDETGNNNLGTHFASKCTIFINKDQAESEKEETFIHEIIEAINCRLCIELKHKQISIISTGLYQVLKSNNMININLDKIGDKT